MLVRRFYDERLAQATWLIGCQRTGEAIVIDPPRDPAEVVEAARKEGVRIGKVTETHIHADYLSGSRELAAATGAQVYLSAEGGPDWLYGWPDMTGVTLIRDGDTIELGGVRIEVIHTPGHTPEHIAFVIVDTARSEEPVALVSGDFIFVGDVGRPDLLEKAAKIEGTMEAGARQLYRSLQRMERFPDHLQIWPGHGAGSACGKALGAVPTSTLGYERRTNWAFNVADEEEFVREVLSGQPNPPFYFAMMKRLNKEGPAVLGDRAPLAAITIADATGAVTVDVRSGREFAAGHLAGALSLPLIKAFTTWAGWLLDYESSIALIANDAAQAEEARTILASIGFDRVIGWITAATVPVDSLVTAVTGDVTTAEEMIDGGRTVIDLREPNEWQSGHIPGAVHHPLGLVQQELASLDRDTPLAIHCQAGTRSGIGAAALARMGFTDVVDLTGGYSGWKAAGRVPA